MNIQLLLTGEELMAGHIVDSNSAMIAEKLEAIGCVIKRKITIGDQLSLLVDEITHISQQSDVLIINGGLGPTIDDLTAEALATASGHPIVEHAEALAHIDQWCQRRQLSLNAANRKQALLPEGVTIVPNPIGSAVGFQLTLNNCIVICTPGVPSELRAMLDETIVNIISQRYPNTEQRSTLRWQTYGLGESTLQQLITKHFPDWPQEVDIGFRAGLPLLEIKLTVSSNSHLPLRQQWADKLKVLIGDYVIGEDNTNLATAVLEQLQQKEKHLTTAESCTGGLIASMITEISGASESFEAGFIAYSDRIKNSILNVDANTLEQYGAVSPQVVEAMAIGALKKTAADYVVAVSGIAGPDGGTKDKPVGTVCIAWGHKNQLNVERLKFTASRKNFQILVAACCLDLLRRELMDIKEEPRYLDNKRF